MIQAIGYVRRSSDKQDESIEQQRMQLERFAESQGWKLAAVYADDAISGSQLSRPGLDRLLQDATTRDDVQVVVTWDRNRLARPKDPIDGVLLERKFREAGKRVVYASTGQESDHSFTSGLVSFIEHHQNGDYLRKLSRDTMRGTLARAKRGLWPGGPIPFGFDRLILDGETPRRIVRDQYDGSQAILDPASGEILEELDKGRRFKKQDHETCSLVPSEPARAEAVGRIFADFAKGVGTRTICNWLNAEGFRTSRGGMFTPQTLIPILENPAYLGRCVYNRRTESKWHRQTNGRSIERADEGIEKRPQDDWVVVEDAWQPLVDPEVFEAVQQRRADAKSRKRHTTGRASRSDYLLSGLFTCGVCGGRMTGTTRTSGKGIRTRSYTCCTRNNGHTDRCPKRYSVPAEHIERFILGHIETELRTLAESDRLQELIEAELRRLADGSDGKAERLRSVLADLEAKLAKVRTHLLDMDPSTARSLGLYDEAERLGSERSEVEAELDRLAVSVPDLPPADQIRAVASELLADLPRLLESGTIDERREFVAHFVKEIEADPAGKSVRISLYRSLFISKIAGAGFEPTTSGL